MSVTDLVKLILVEPEQPRNVGAAVRVAANFGYGSVTVVQEADLTVEELREVRIASSGAVDVVDLITVPSLEEALKGSMTIIGTSGRHRSTTLPVVDKLGDVPPNGPLAVVFGRESNGLTSAELEMCHYLLRLPVSDKFPSMNLSHAVAIVAYQAVVKVPSEHLTPTVAPRHIQEVWIQKAIGQESKMAGQLRRFLYKANPTEEEMALLFNLLKTQRQG